MKTTTTGKREYARANMQKDGEVEIDEDAEVSMGDDPGAYVQAWVWVPRCDVPELQNESSCRECGGECQIDEDGISNHIDADGNIDHDTDADHVAVMDGREE